MPCLPGRRRAVSLKSNPYFQVYTEQGLAAFLRVLEDEPHSTPALRAAIAVLRLESK